MEIDGLVRGIDAKCAAIRSAEDALTWRVQRGEAEHAHRVDFDDSDWPTVLLNTPWSSGSGALWARRQFRYPDFVESIPVVGATIELPLFVLVHSRIFVDGQEKVAEPSWLDSRAVPLVLCDDYQSGQSIQVALQAYQGDGFGLCVVQRVSISTLEQVIWRLETLREQLRFTHYLAFQSADANKEWADLWEQATQGLKLDALAANAWDTWWQSTESCVDHLRPLDAEAKSYVTHLVGHSHIDMNWLWPWPETVDVVRRDFLAADSLMARYPEFCFSQSQASTYWAMANDYPQVLERVQERVSEGRWDVTATTWVEGDLNMASGESLVRQMLLTRPYIKELLGVRPRICWEPDTFGHVATLPQLLKQAGVDAYYCCRAGRGESLFWWEGLDGSRVLAVCDPMHYNGIVEPKGTVWPALDVAQRYSLKRSLYLYGVGDHGGGATARDIEAAAVLNDTPLLPQARMSSAIAFYDQVRAEKPQLPVVRGELNTVFEGCYTTHGDIKKYNRTCENQLLSAEALSALAAFFAARPYPAKALTEGWRTLLFNQFHDILCGCAIGVTFEHAARELEPVVVSSANLITEAASSLADCVDISAHAGPCCVIWNPVAWERTDLVRVPAGTFGEVPSAVVDDAGNVAAVQVSGDELLFIASAVPSLGCRVYWPIDQVADSEVAATEDGALSNGLLWLHINSRSGAIDRFVDTEHDRTIDTLGKGVGVESKSSAGLINRLQLLWEAPHSMSAWSIGDITRAENLVSGAQVRVLEQGPVRAVVEVTHQPLNSRITQRYCIYAGMRRVDIETELDWHEHGGSDHDAPMLRATFKPALADGRATFEVPYAGLERPATGDEVPALRWADVSDDAYGLSLLNECKYGHQAHGNTLGLTLVRAAYEPDTAPDQGLQHFTYALYPHVSDWRAAASERRAAELNQPLVAVPSAAHAGTLESNQPMLTCDRVNVMVTACKVAERDSADAGSVEMILRLVEMHGVETDAVLHWIWPTARVDTVNILEEGGAEIESRADQCSVHLAPHQVVTLRLHTTKEI